MASKGAKPQLTSMTGFASGGGAVGGYSWTCELRSVNGKGLDLRLRVPDWIDGLETALRAAFTGKVARGNVTLSVRVSRDDQAAELAINPAQLSALMDVLQQIEAAAAARNMATTPICATDIAAMRGVLDTSTGDDDMAPVKAAIVADVTQHIDALQTMRRNEGAALHAILTRQLDEMAALVTEAGALAAARADATAETLQANLVKVMAAADGVDPDRVAQELALIAVKADVTEEIDRLRAHIASAHDLLSAEGAVGRKLDFLMQEFNREANTLCSKAQHAELTKTGLALKALIDQMREQVQNVE